MIKILKAVAPNDTELERTEFLWVDGDTLASPSQLCEWLEYLKTRLYTVESMSEFTDSAQSIYRKILEVADSIKEVEQSWR